MPGFQSGSENTQFPDRPFRWSNVHLAVREPALGARRRLAADQCDRANAGTTTLGVLAAPLFGVRPANSRPHSGQPSNPQDPVVALAAPNPAGVAQLNDRTR